jgi:hypothetical protein
VIAPSLNEQVLPKSDLVNLAMELTASPTLAGSVCGELNRMRRKPSKNSAGKLEPNETNNDNIRNIECESVARLPSCKHAAATMMRAPLFTHLRMTKWRIPIYRDVKCLNLPPLERVEGRIARRGCLLLIIPAEVSYENWTCLPMMPPLSTPRKCRN